jgi:hypothetical protein
MATMSKLLLMVLLMVLVLLILRVIRSAAADLNWAATASKAGTFVFLPAAG